MTLLGWECEPRLEAMLRKDVVCSDGGWHLTTKANSFAAVSLCCRVAQVELFIKSVGRMKRRKLE